jgi:hypothetical protein
MKPLILLLGTLVVATVLLDPYTFHLNASDYLQPAPAWQLSLGLVDALLVVSGVLVAWRGRREIGFLVLSFEALFTLGLCAILVHRDGVERFVAGIGAQEYLSVYLAALALRILLLVVVHRMPTATAQAAV